MHYHHRQIIPGSHLCHFPRFFLILKAPDIIQDMHTMLCCKGCRFRLEGINGNRHRACRNHRLKKRLQPFYLILGRHGHKARTAGLGTYIDNIGTIDHHLQHVLHSFVHAVPLAAIRKRVRSYVQYAHNQGSAANFQLLAILPCILPICFTQYICHFSHIQLPITFHTSIVIL